MSDAEVDALLEKSFQSKDYATYGACASEIAGRMASGWSFITGVFGGQRFPNYEKHAGGFTQAGAAQDAVKVSATNLADKVASVTTSIYEKALIAGVVFGVIVYIMKSKSK